MPTLHDTVPGAQERPTGDERRVGAAFLDLDWRSSHSQMLGELWFTLTLCEAVGAELPRTGAEYLLRMPPHPADPGRRIILGTLRDCEHLLMRRLDVMGVAA